MSEQSSVKQHPGDVSSELQDMLGKYGEAVDRVGQLEHQVRLLLEQGHRVKAAPDAAGQDRLRQIEQELNKKDQAMAAMQSQIGMLNQALTKAEDKYKQAAEGSYMRHRRRHRKWWQFWRPSSNH